MRILTNEGQEWAKTGDDKRPGVLLSFSESDTLLKALHKGDAKQALAIVQGAKWASEWIKED